MAGLALGLAFSTIMFIYNYSRLSVVRQTSSGVELRSNVDRSPSASRFLNHNGAVVHVIQLQDYLFFGTAEQVASQVRQRLNAEDLPPLRFLILDFKGVSGIDSAATSCFLKICAISESYNARVQFSGLPKNVLPVGSLDAARDFNLRKTLRRCSKPPIWIMPWNGARKSCWLRRKLTAGLWR